MSTEEIRNALGPIMLPEVERSLASLNLIREVTMDDGKVRLSIANSGLSSELQGWLEKRLSLSGRSLPGVKEVAVEFVNTKPRELNQIKNAFAVMSGKGGVGKSLVSALLAIAFKRQGMTVGILDADITGPSIPHIFGIKKRPVGSETGVFPTASSSGIQIMSINLLLPHADDLVRWRGPVISGTIKQFWEQVIWGNLDLLIIDLPPGTADAPQTVMQALPLSGAIVVFTPQALVGMIVRKAIKLSQKMNVPIRGVVENMSYFVLPDSGKRIELFGKSRADEITALTGAPLLGQIPIDPKLAQLCDSGQIEQYDSELVTDLVRGLSEGMKR